MNYKVIAILVLLVIYMFMLKRMKERSKAMATQEPEVEKYDFDDLKKPEQEVNKELDVCIPVREQPEKKDEIAVWFHEKWGVPMEAYQESINECVENGIGVPQWYVVVRGDKIVGGCGVIENDFHERMDLAPNVCAVYVEEEYRNQGIAGLLLNYVCDDMAAMGIKTLYLLTDHTGFYERYGWEFYCMVKGSDEELSRMYIHTV